MNSSTKELMEALNNNEQLKWCSGRKSAKIEQWLPIIELSNIKLGLDRSGSWVVENKKKLISLNETNSFGFVISLMEKSKVEVVSVLEQFSIDEKVNIELVNKFPFIEIIKSGLSQKSDYWAELALQWLAEVDKSKKCLLKEELSTVIKSKWASQKIRSLASKELKKITSKND